MIRMLSVSEVKKQEADSAGSATDSDTVVSHCVHDERTVVHNAPVTLKTAAGQRHYR
jgi:hypothetical protein